MRVRVWLIYVHIYIYIEYDQSERKETLYRTCDASYLIIIVLGALIDRVERSRCIVAKFIEQQKLTRF
jgi:hypothetical protein